MVFKKSISVLLFLAVLFSAVFPVASLSLPVGAVSGESGRFYEDIKLSDGTVTGVRYTQMNLSGTYGSGKVLRLAECDLSNTNLSIEVINCGSATVKSATVASASKTASVGGKTVLCALNGDLWMTAVNSNTNVTKQVLKATRGIMIIDGEVWATQEFGMENYMNTSGASTAAAPKSAFGVTDKNQPLVGVPVFSVTVKNETKNKTVAADGLNRLPAWDSVVVYNHRINSSNYALNDSYEVELTTSSSAFTVDGKVTATVKAVYPSGSTTRPSIGANSIIITARGSRMDEVSGSFSVGDTVSFDLDLVDTYGRTELWHSVTDAIGGHMQVINDDAQTMFDTRSSEYPTSLIGVKDDGTVMFANVAASTNGVYKGLRFKDAYNLCRELGYNSVFYLDGGGSAAIVTLKDGTYTQRNYSSDGSARAVINAVAMVWNSTPVCEKQGSLGYLTTKEELGSLSPAFIPAGVLQKIGNNENMVVTDYISAENAFRVSVANSTNDPFVWLDVKKFNELIDTAKYKFVTLKIKSNVPADTPVTLYYMTTGQTAIQNKTATLVRGDKYSYVTFMMGAESGWNGSLTSLRLDIFDGLQSTKGQYADVEFIAFSQTIREAAQMANGVYPVGSIKNYYAYKDCNGVHTYTVFSNHDGDFHRSECSLCGYSVLAAHTETDGTYVAPTCTAVGTKTTVCGDCGRVMSTETLPVTGHTAVSGTYVAPTCTKEGIRTTVCKSCDCVISTETLPTVPHTYSDEYTVDVEATSTREGEKSRHCLYCSARTDVTAIPVVTTLVKGDLSGDGKINAMDANTAKRVLNGSSVMTEAMRLAGDANGDGQFNSVDTNILTRYLLGYISRLS